MFFQDLHELVSIMRLFGNADHDRYAAGEHIDCLHVGFYCFVSSSVRWVHGCRDETLLFRELPRHLT
jgi:hypothetical protein